MNETDYHMLADRQLDRIAQTLEDADQQGLIELEQDAGVVTIALNDKRQFIVSKHSPTRQIWLSSPVSGGLHFVYDGQEWRIADKRTLTDVLYSELGQVAGGKA